MKIRILLYVRDDIVYSDTLTYLDIVSLYRYLRVLRKQIGFTEAVITIKGEDIDQSGVTDT